MTVLGSALAMWMHQATGPIIITLAASGFFLTFLRGERYSA